MDNQAKPPATIVVGWSEYDALKKIAAALMAMPLGVLMELPGGNALIQECGVYLYAKRNQPPPAAN